MSRQHDAVADALLRVANLKRTLAIAREVRDRAFSMGLASDVVGSLIRQLSEAELEACRLIGAAGVTLDCGGHVSVKRDDRRDNPRPCFTYRHSHLARVVT